MSLVNFFTRYPQKNRHWLTVMALLIIVTSTKAVDAAELTVAVASNFVAPMKLLATEFERQSGHKIKLVAGASGKLYAQINHGAPYQLLFSADQTIPAALIKEGLAVPDSQLTYAIGALALWSAKADFVDEFGSVLRQSTFNKLAIANPRVAPYGVAALEVLRKLGLEQRVQTRLVMGESIAQAYQFVATGNADIGFVALAQVMENGVLKSGSLWRIPSALHKPIKQDAVLLRNGQHNAAAQAFLHFIRSQSARAIIIRFGYSVPA